MGMPRLRHPPTINEEGKKTYESNRDRQKNR